MSDELTPEQIADYRETIRIAKQRSAVLELCREALMAVAATDDHADPSVRSTVRAALKIVRAALAPNRIDAAMSHEDEALVHAHDALAFLGTVKMLELSPFMFSVAIAAAEVWASGERPTDIRVAKLLNVSNPDGYKTVGEKLAQLLHLDPAWNQRT